MRPRMKHGETSATTLVSFELAMHCAGRLACVEFALVALLSLEGRLGGPRQWT
ncbi:MAG: hypothetical protein JWO42_2792 [Chloroflexi bacterium]|nr:hypothetical protein [Chloroflexota bacterium]